VTAEQANIECIMFADDLSGACDTGVQFARRGMSCRVQLRVSERTTTATTEVLVFNTNSRNDTAVQCQRKIEEVARHFSHLKADIIFKKVDSTLRGQVGEEIATALRAFKCEAAIIAPAFPGMRRFVRGGILHWVDCSGGGQVDIRGLLAKQGVPLEKLALMRSASRNPLNFASDLNMHRVNGKVFFIADCESQDDLHLAVTAGMQAPCRFLWVGSAGLGIAVADYLAKSQTQKPLSPIADAPVMFVIGSTHLATARQKRALLDITGAVEVRPGPETIGIARHALRDKRHLVVSIAPVNPSDLSLQQFFVSLEGIPIAAIFLTGGDTGMLVCNVIGAHSIDLRDEVATGFPWGILCGGMFHGLPVASKSGSFGDEDVLVRCAEFFAPARKATR